MTAVLLHTDASLAAGRPVPFDGARYKRQEALGRAALTGARMPTGSVLALNYHAVPVQDRLRVVGQIGRAAALGERFDPDRPTDALQVLVAFYDGDQSTGRWAAEACADLGVSAFFFPVWHTRWESGRRLTDADLQRVAEAGHELCFHTATHRMARKILPHRLAGEVVGPIRRLTAAQGRPPRLGAWMGGGRYDGSLAARTARDLGVTHIVSNWSVEETVQQRNLVTPPK